MSNILRPSICGVKIIIMKMLAVAFIFFLALSPSVSLDIYYLRSTDSPPSSCPNQPCLTLHQSGQINNISSGTTLIFLPGYHDPKNSTLNIANASNITLRGQPGANIICSTVAVIQCENVTNLKIEELNFQLGGSQICQAFAIKLMECVKT